MTERKWTGVCVSGLAGMAMTLSGTEALAKKIPKDYSPMVFDAAKRKKTKSQLTDRISYSAYASLRFQGERNLRLDDGAPDRSDGFAVYVGVSARAQLSDRVLAFTHMELDLRQKTTHRMSYSITKKLNVKEALIAYKISDQATLTVGRMRFSDAHKWIVDASVDGVHFALKTGDRGFEAAVFQDVFKDGGTYALLHATRHWGKDHAGVYALAEHTGSDRRMYLAGYFKNTPNENLNYTLHAAGVFGDAANGRSSGFGFDARATYKFGDTGKPQITFGLAGGTEGFRQTGLHSNKTYDGGQTQFHRYGYVYQPELTNLAVATVALGFRPSRNFSLDLGGHVYVQPQKSTTSPTARVRGETTGRSGYLGSELSLAGAWRPSRKSKVEFGIGVFKPGSAYVNRGTVKRVYARVSMYF